MGCRGPNQGMTDKNNLFGGSRSQYPPNWGSLAEVTAGLDY
jgi:hypothetical protein